MNHDYRSSLSRILNKRAEIISEGKRSTLNVMYRIRSLLEKRSDSDELSDEIDDEEEAEEEEEAP